jgi:hypothetical protein
MIPYGPRPPFSEKVVGQQRDQGEEPMPVIDVYVEADLFSAKSLRVLGTDLTQAVLRGSGKSADFTSRTERRKIAIESHREECGRNRAHALRLAMLKSRTSRSKSAALAPGAKAVPRQWCRSAPAKLASVC